MSIKNKDGIDITDDNDVINWINKFKRIFQADKIYITTECLERLNQIFCVNSISVLENAKTILGLRIIEITPTTKFTYEEFLNFEKEIMIDSIYKINCMVNWDEPPRLKKWQ